MKSSNAYPGRSVYIVDGTRTPFLKARGKPGAFAASDLAVACGQELFKRLPITAEQIDEVILGCAMPSPDEANIARIVALRLGCGKSVPGWTVQRNCASGLQALDSAAHDISSGRYDIVLAGGTDAMSRTPVLLNNQMVTWLGKMNSAKTAIQKAKLLMQIKPKMLKPIIGLLRGLTDPVVGLSMGQTAEILAHRFAISREQMDRFALQSHQRLSKAQKENILTEINPIYDTRGNYYLCDDGLRPDTSMAQLGKLKPFFDKKYGHVTAGNSSQITDGAALLLLASEDAIKQHDLPILGKVVDLEWAALDPAQMGLGPVFSSAPLMKRNKLSLSDVDYWEINEAFAAQVLACIKALNDKSFCCNELGLEDKVGEIDQQVLNIYGDAICMGHPIGASGARIVLQLLNVLKRNSATRGIASLCVGGGQGGAMLVEQVETIKPKSKSTSKSKD